MKKLICTLIFIVISGLLLAQDTILVQTLTFDSITTRRGKWLFPDSMQNFRKVLMLYTLKCDQATTADQYPCGEWDYLTYAMVYHHTKTLDSNALTHPYFKIGQQSPDSIRLLSAPVLNYYNNYQYHQVMDAIVSENAYVNGAYDIASVYPLNFSEKISRVQYLWRASELLASGLTAGNIQRLMLDVLSPGSGSSRFGIRIKHTTDTSLSAFSEGNFTSVYHSYFQPVAGPNIFNFLQPFNWDGVSNIIVEFYFSHSMQGTDATLKTFQTLYPSGLVSATSSSCLHFNGNDYVWLPVDSLATFNDQITISFRMYGDPEFQPQDGTLFEAVNSQNQRVLNVHLPWGNSNVYWDAGRSGGNYDRINKAANSEDFEGRWNHWAFTKNASTGEMKIYLNGVLWHSGTGKTAQMNGISGFRIGANFWGGQMYRGKVDEFTIWNKELDALTINAWKDRRLTDTHPDFASLKYYYPFDEADGFETENPANPGLKAGLLGCPAHEKLSDSSLFCIDSVLYQRPVISLYQGNYNMHKDSVLVCDTLEQSAKSLVFYQINQHNVAAFDTIYGWESGYSYVFTNGQKTDSIATASGFLYVNNPLQYFSEPYEKVIPYEIGRYITPYGINLTLGPDGTTWIYDVTDYRYLLTDTVDLSAGNNQELIDLKFMFIEGEPMANVVSFDDIWDHGYGSYYYKDLADDTKLKGKMMAVDSVAETIKVKTRITGHGHNSNTGSYPHCCEWKDNTHYLFINDSLFADWLIFKYHECALNPLYPQGGTWPGAREGWCPGDKVSDHEFNITSAVNGDSVKIDYDITDVPASNLGMGNGNYVMSMQLLQYGPAIHQLDAEVYDVIAPSKDFYYSRINPVCYEPRIIMRNSGKQTLTSADIIYSVSGGQQLTYHWNGSLAYMEKTEIVLPVDTATFWLGNGQNIFQVNIANPNGQSDEYSDNNTWHSPFNMPAWASGPIMIWMKTNNLPADNSYTVKDVNGNVVFSKDGLTANTNYKDTLYLQPGCYTFELLDEGDDGLYYWAYTQQGSGYCNIRLLSGTILKTFQNEFGRSIYYSFTVGDMFYISEQEEYRHFDVYPNPAEDYINIDITGFSGKPVIRIFNIYGNMVFEKQYLNDGVYSGRIDTDKLSKGIYFVTLYHNGQTISRKIVIS